jgi:hypothetical protein
MALQQPLEYLAHILEQVKAIGDLDGVRGTPRGAVGVLRRAIAANVGDAGVLLQPAFDGRRRAVLQEIDRDMGLEVDQNRAIRAPLAPRIELSRPVTEPARLQNRA